ncbi:hypothetical protein BV20DRAFT_969872 [Pilatotrama ljubarskyi]|nr:hypothetical protein BV20DRAFT_969872 [Pilatotrama ljubarskyi]
MADGAIPPSSLRGKQYQMDSAMSSEKKQSTAEAVWDGAMTVAAYAYVPCLLPVFLCTTLRCAWCNPSS